MQGLKGVKYSVMSPDIKKQTTTDPTWSPTGWLVESPDLFNMLCSTLIIPCVHIMQIGVVLNVEVMFNSY